MDTRSKIIAPEQAIHIARARRARIVTGYFDPLLAAHAERLAEIRTAGGDTPLIAFVLDPPEPILAARARAELVAALAVVDHVVPLARVDAQPLLAQLQTLEVFREEHADLQRTEALIQHVHHRHKA